MASNLISLPLKLQYKPPPIELAQCLVDFVQLNETSVHPQQILSDSHTLEHSRNTVYNTGLTTLSSSTINQILSYHHQLRIAILKFPSNVGCVFSYLQLYSQPPDLTATSSSSLPGTFKPSTSTNQRHTYTSHKSLTWESHVLLYNLAAVYAYIGTTSPRKDEQSLKTALAALQNAAGVLDHLLTMVKSAGATSASASSSSISHSTFSGEALYDPEPFSVDHQDDDAELDSNSTDPDPNLASNDDDLSVESISALRDLCLAQAQEIAWQKAVLGRMKNTTIAKLALAVSQLYASSHAHIQALNSNSADRTRTRSAEDSAGSSSHEQAHVSDRAAQQGQWRFPETIKTFVRVKQWHFEAVAQFRRSMDDLSANRYGDELTRLSLAEDAVKQALAACGSSGGASLSASGLSSAASGTGIGSGFGAAFSRKMTGSGAGIETGTTADATTSTGARGLPEGVVRDLKGLLKTLVDNKARAVKDNSLIYLEAPTPVTALPAFAPAMLARSTPPPELTNPSQVQGPSPSSPPSLFASLVPREAHAAFALYADRRSELVKTRILDPCARAESVERALLHELNLPAALDVAMSQSQSPGGAAAAAGGGGGGTTLPGWVRERSREVRREGGVQRLRAMMTDVRMVARQARSMVDEMNGLIAQEDEHSQTERARGRAQRSGGDDGLNSDAAATDLTNQAARKALREQVNNYARIVEQAAQSDQLVRTKFGEWEHKIERVGGDDEDELERSIPRVGVAGAGSSSVRAGPIDAQTLSVRTLRRLLDDLMDLQLARAQLVSDAKLTTQHQSHRDDSRAKGVIVAEAERLVRAQQQQGQNGPGPSTGQGTGMGVPMALFEDVIERLVEGPGGIKERVFVEDVDMNLAKQSDLLEQVKVAHATFVTSRKTDPALGERERALSDLNSTFAIHRELVTNLEEGLRFYTDLSRLLGELRDQVRGWTRTRLNQSIAKAPSQAQRAAGGQGVKPVTSSQVNDVDPMASHLSRRVEKVQLGGGDDDRDGGQVGQGVPDAGGAWQPKFGIRFG